MGQGVNRAFQEIQTIRGWNSTKIAQTPNNSPYFELQSKPARNGKAKRKQIHIP